MKWEILVLASLLVALSGVSFAVPLGYVSAEEALACPGHACVINPAKGAAVEADLEHMCYSGPNHENCEACCQQCVNGGYEIIVGDEYCDYPLQYCSVVGGKHIPCP